MAFVDDFIANFGRDLAQAIKSPLSNLNALGSGIASTLVQEGLTPIQLLLVTEQALVGFASGETGTDFPGRMNAAAGAVFSLAPLAAYTASFGEVNVLTMIFDAGFAISGSGVVATSATVLLPLVAGLLVTSAAQAYAETLQSYANGGAGYQLTNPNEQAGFALIGMQYDADLGLAGTPNADAVASIITPGAVLSINFDPTLWKSTYGGNPPEGFAANDITGRTVLLEGILGSLSGTDGSESLALIQGSLDPVVTEILVSNVSGAPISDSGVANAYGKGYGEAFILGNTAGSTLTPTGTSFDAFIAQGQSNTIDFTASAANGSGGNLVEMVNGGTLTIKAADRTDCTIIWDTSGIGTIAINGSDNSTVTVIEVDIPDATKASFLAMDQTQLDALFGPSIVIVNPTASEHITFDGVPLTSPTVVDVPNPNYNPNLYNPGEPNGNLTPYYEQWQAGGLQYSSGAVSDDPGYSFVSATLGTGTDNTRTIDLFGFNNGDFGFSVPTSRTYFDLFTGAKQSMATQFNGHQPATAADYLAQASAPQPNVIYTPTSITGDTNGSVDPTNGGLTTSGTITPQNPYSWLDSFSALTPDDFNAPDGTFTFDTASGKWTFTLDPNSAHYLSLAPGQTSLDQLTVYTLDGSAHTITVQVTAGLNTYSVAEFLGGLGQITVSVTIDDTAANVTANLAALAAAGHISAISLSDPNAPALNLTAAQALAGLSVLGLITSPHTLTVTDSAAHIAALTSSQIGALGAAGLTTLVATGSEPSLTQAQRQALGSAGITLTEPYTGGQLASVTFNADGSTHDILYTNITGQAWDSADVVYGAGGKLVSEAWTSNGAMVQSQTWNADGTVHDRTYYSTNGQVETIDFVNGAQSEILYTGIPGQPWDSIDALYSTTTGKLTSETWTTAGALYQTETWNSDGSVHEIHHYQAGQINGAAYTDTDILYGSNGKEVLRTYYDNGVAGEVISQTYSTSNVLGEVLYSNVPNAAWDTIDYLYDGSGHLQQTVWSEGGTLGAGGTFIQEQNYRSDGTVASRIYGAGNGYSQLEYDYNAAGSTQVLKNQTNLDGSHTITGLVSGVTLTSTTGVADTLTGGGTSETFVFGAAFGHDTITDLATHLSGAGADTLQFSANVFASAAAVLGAATQDGAGNAVITDTAGDSVTLKGVSLATLSANASLIKVA